MTNRWQCDFERGRRLTAGIGLIGLMAICFVGAIVSIPALGQDEKLYHERSEGGAIEAAPAVSKGWRSSVTRLSHGARGGAVDVYFLGDSLTQFWQNQGHAVWTLDYAPLNAANFGIAADRVENILWRLRNGNLGELQPKVFVLMMGTNNLAATPADSPAKVVHGIVQVLAFIVNERPSARVLLLSILPNGDDPQSEVRENITRTNGLLAKACDGMDSVEFVDVHDSFLDNEGRWKPELTLDGTHLSTRVYDVLSNRLRPILAKALTYDSTEKKAP